MNGQRGEECRPWYGLNRTPGTYFRSVVNLARPSLASRTNGCIFCASVHSRFARHHSKRPDDVQRLLDEGTAAQQDDPAWRAVIDASVALTRIPDEFGASEVRALREAGLDDVAIIDAINGAAFFNWANRLMLSLGEPTPPAQG